MFNIGPLDIVVAFLVSTRRFGLCKTVLGAIAVAIGIQPFLPPVPCTCFGPMLRRCDYGRRYEAALKSDLKNLASQEEIYFSDALRYTDDARALGFVQSNGVTVTVRATARGWTAWATHVALGDDEGCALFYGSDAPLVDAAAADWVGDLLRGPPAEVRCT